MTKMIKKMKKIINSKVKFFLLILVKILLIPISELFVKNLNFKNKQMYFI